MIVYAETSAVLRWLLGDVRGEEVRRSLARTEHVATSRLTIIETHRALIRAHALGELVETDALAAAADFAMACARWTVVEILPEIAERACQRFPAEPIRTLDALHLATALFLGPVVGPVTVLSTDNRIVKNVPLVGLALALES